MQSNKMDVWERLNDKEVFFIAEIGKNFIQTKEEKETGQYLAQAKKLVDKAKEAGADAVKFQTHHYQDEQMPIRVVAPHFSGADRFAWVKRNSVITNGDFWPEIKQHCDEVGIMFFSAPMSRGAAKILSGIGVKLWKVGSGDILDFVMLDYIRQTGLPIIISSGMSSLKELEKALGFIREKNERIALMHCVSKYPCPVEELNVGTVKMFRRKYKMPIGFSDHSIGWDGVVQAVKCGATIIEKHFTLDRDMWGSDHKVSMIPREYKEMVQVVRSGVAKFRINKQILGCVNNELADSESVFRGLFRKSLVAGKIIKKGDVIEPTMLLAMRPQAYINGVGSEYYSEVVGKRARRNMEAQEPFTEEDVDRWRKVDNKKKTDRVRSMSL